ncbi:hypothetical protein [Brevibacillus borstelensis]|uniref:spermidine synthase n=1 Tax=Brevibacillus borstelensis TaxID=45462 RepID=UPI0030C0D1F9
MDSQVNSGLYSSKKILLHTIESLIVNDRIFVGNQSDEFAIAGFIESAQKILMLGLGYGGALRPLLIGNDDVEITAVDLNPHVLNACKSIIKDYFPEVSRKIKYVHGDGARVNEYFSTPFDVVCIDLYTDEGYPSFVLENEFWSMVTEILTPEGVVLFNSWGLPQHLRPFEGRTVHVQLAQIIQNYFKSVHLLPYRRNITFIANKQRVLNIHKRKSSYTLNDIDRIIVELIPHRLNYAKNLEELHFFRDGMLATGMKEIDAEMLRRWPRLVNKINSVLLDIGYPKIESSELRQLIYDAERSRAVTERLIEINAPESTFVPTAMGAFAFEEPRGLEWYIKWILEDNAKLIKLNKEWFVNQALWQLLAMVANPYAHYKEWVVDIEHMVKQLKLG